MISYTFTFYAYVNIQIFCVDNYLTDIKYSGGAINPITSYLTYLTLIKLGSDYIYYFKEFKHNFEEYICINIINTSAPGGFSFYEANINEYNISLLKDTKFFICRGSNMNTETNFKIDDTCDNRPFIDISYINGNGFIQSEFCIKSTNDISIFNTRENNINKKYYKTKNDLKYILNNDTDYFYIDEIFSINHNPEFKTDLYTFSYRIKNITNKKGYLYNGKNEIFLNTVFNPEDKFLTYDKSNFDNGYIMIINIETRTRLTETNISYLTCEEPANLFIYISQKNCSMSNYSNNFCQFCIENFEI